MNGRDSGLPTGKIPEARPEVSEAGYELYPGSLFRTEFAVTKGLKSARAYISGLGYYELRLNGAKVGGQGPGAGANGL